MDVSASKLRQVKCSLLQAVEKVYSDFAMSVVVFQHEANEPAEVLGAALTAHGHRLRTITLYDAEQVPIDLDDIEGIISMGGPMNLDQPNGHDWMEPEMACIRRAHDRGLAIVGICLGHQLIAKALGGDVELMPEPEVGFELVQLTFAGTIDPVMAGITWQTPQVHMHGHQVVKLPDQATPLAQSARCKTQAFKVGMRTYGFQYHLEWDRPAIARHSDNDLVGQSPISQQDIGRQCQQNYDHFRHMGDRLCRNIAQLLFGG